MLVAVGVSFGQSVIFNAPTTDTQERGTYYLEADFITKPKSYDKGGFQTYGYRMVYGVDRRTEIGANFFVTRDGTDLPREVQFNFKRNLYKSEKNGVGVSSGALVSVPLTKSAGSRPVTLVYTNASKVLPQLNTRLTGGVYGVVGVKRSFGKRWGFMVGVEQPVTKRIALISDWYSGKNRFGFAFVGVNIAVTKRQFLSFGYNFSNASGEENSLAITYGVVF